MSVPRTRQPSRRAARWMGVAVVTGGLVTSAALVWQASYSAFSATTANPTDNWSAGTVSLADDDNGSALFTVSNMKPGATGTRCIVVTSSGSLASAVHLYTTTNSFTQTNALADNMTLSVTQGTSTSTGGNCNGFVADTGAGTTFTGTLTAFSTTYTTFANGMGTWAPTGAAAEKQTYQITYTLNSSATNAQQGGTAAIGFTWEAQNS